MAKKQKKLKTKRYLLGLVVLLAVGIIEMVLILGHTDKKAVKTINSPVGSGSQAAPSFNKSQYSVDAASSLWVVVNKGRALPNDYVPASLAVPNVPLRLGASSPEMHVRADTASALEALFAGAKADGLNLMLASGYRSYADQVATYDGFVRQDGQASADTYSARPGHSEHQTGLAADLEPTSRVCELQDCFGSTPEGKWLAANAYKYGFIIRYQQNNQNLTGYIYEPWHVRYVGKDLAAQIESSGQTLEQFFGLPAYTSYPVQGYQLQ